MRIRLRRLVITLVLVFTTGCVFLLNSAFKDFDLQFRHLKRNRIYNSRDIVVERGANISSGRDNVTTDAPVLTTIRHMSSDIISDTPSRAHGDCPSVIVLPMLGVKYSWQGVDGKQQVYVFSAYLEGRTVRLIGAKTSSRTQLYCQLYYRLNKTDASMESVAANARTIPEGHGRKYTATHFLCEFSGSRKPYAVSVVETRCGNPVNIVSIYTNKIEKKRNYSVCATPMNFHYNRAYELIEWIELNRILGVDFFTLYNHTTGPAVDRVLNYYSRQAILEVIPWKLPMGVDTWPRENTPVEIHYFGQLAASNDCLRRNRNQTKYLLVIDLDEFIIPRAERVITLADMMKNLPDSGAYIFCNTFFREDWDDTLIDFDNKDNAIKLRLNTLLKLNRELKISPHNMRSKYIVQPNDAEVLGIHQVWSMGRNTIHRVPKEVALLHHYRNWENPNDKKGQVEDRVVLDRFRSVLIDKVTDVWKRLKIV